MIKAAGFESWQLFYTFVLILRTFVLETIEFNCGKYIIANKKGGNGWEK